MSYYVKHLNALKFAEMLDEQQSCQLWKLKF